MWKHNKPELLFILVGVLAQIVNAAVSPTISLIFSNIWSIFSIPDEAEQERESLKYMGMILGLAFVNLASSILLNYSFSLIGARLIQRIRVKMFESYLRQEVAYHDLDENKSAILSTRLASSVPFCKGITSDLLSLFCQAVSGVGFSVVVGLVLNWKLCLVILCFIPINIVAGMMNIQSVTNKQGKKKTSEEESGRLAIEVVEHIKTVISLGREGYFVAQFEALFSRNSSKLLGYLHVQALFYGVANSVLFFIQAAAFSYGYYLIKYEDLALTDLFRIYASITFTSMTLGRIFAQMPDVKKSREAVKMALSTIDRVSRIDSMSQSGQRPADHAISGDIRFNNVTFSYPNRPNLKVLHNFSLDVKRGQVNALVGKSAKC
jgi:ABC-type bacteriocin/lantibiotic exporter with double-glycine peptidase domain